MWRIPESKSQRWKKKYNELKSPVCQLDSGHIRHIAICIFSWKKKWNVWVFQFSSLKCWMLDYRHCSAYSVVNIFMNDWPTEWLYIIYILLKLNEMAFGGFNVWGLGYPNRCSPGHEIILQTATIMCRFIRHNAITENVTVFLLVVVLSVRFKFAFGLMWLYAM